MDSTSESKPYDRRPEAGFASPGPYGNDSTISLLQLQQYKADAVASQPFARYQYVDVTFTTANADLLIPHKLVTTDPEAVDYIVTRIDRATTIYNDQSGTRQMWSNGYILLRSSVANASCRLLLITRRLPSAERP